MRPSSVVLHADFYAHFEVATDELVGHHTDDALCKKVAEVAPWPRMLLREAKIFESPANCYSLFVLQSVPRNGLLKSNLD